MARHTHQHQQQQNHQRTSARDQRTAQVQSARARRPLAEALPSVVPQSYNPVRAVACQQVGLPYGPVRIAPPGSRQPLASVVTYEIGTSRQAAQGAYLPLSDLPLSALPATPESRAKADAWRMARGGRALAEQDATDAARELASTAAV